jgi:hypothetical protein
LKISAAGVETIFVVLINLIKAVLVNLTDLVILVMVEMVSVLVNSVQVIMRTTIWRCLGDYEGGYCHGDCEAELGLGMYSAVRPCVDVFLEPEGALC